MKKSKLTICLIILALTLCLPLLSACQRKIRLTTPTDIAFQINQDTGKQLLVTEENIYASGYSFYFSTIYDKEDTSNFLRYDESKNYLDVTDYFKNSQTYYFFVKYKGSGNYIDSYSSNVESYTIQNKLDAPTLSLNGTTLTWTKITGAKYYSVYSIIDNSEEAVTGAQSISETTFDLSTYLNSKINSGLDKQISFLVFCNQNGNNLRSVNSNFVNYNSHLQLSVPTNFAISISNGEHILSWISVKNATKYSVKINTTTILEVVEGDYAISNGVISLNVESYFSELGDYYFSVKSVGVGNFISSDFCAQIKYTFTKKLSTPTNFSYTEGMNENTVEFFWDSVENAISYSLYINDSKFIPSNGSGVESSIVINSITLTYENLSISTIQDLGSFVIQVQADGYSYYLASAKTNMVSYKKRSTLLASPNIIDDSENYQLSWNKVDSAKEYQISII